MKLNPLEKGIVWPVVYASVFEAPVPEEKLFERVVGIEASREQIEAALQSENLRSLLARAGGRISIAGRAFGEIPERRFRATRELLRRGEGMLDFVRALPHVRMAALSGACAHDAAEDGDIDIFVVTRPGAVWRTLLWSTLVAKARGWRRTLCMNYLVDEWALALPWRDFYGAFELISLKPFKGEDGFKDLLWANPWAGPIFPNFFRERLHGQNPPNKSLTARGGQLIEATARMIHRPYLRHRLPKSPGVELSDHVVRLHATDHRERLRGLFLDALSQLSLEAPPWI